MFFRPLLFVVAGVITAHAGSAQHATEPASLDLILAGGTVHDGTGAAGTARPDWVEGPGLADGLEPPSLYEDQLARRLGID